MLQTFFKPGKTFAFVVILLGHYRDIPWQIPRVESCASGGNHGKDFGFSLIRRAARHNGY
jgi:hypothetical protein